jgi:hypothetical protein
MGTNKKTARLAGFLWLLQIVFGLFNELGARGRLFIHGDVTATAINITSNEFLFRLGLLSESVMYLSLLFTALVLCKLLSIINKSWARLIVIFAALGCGIGLLSLLNEVAALQLLSGAAYLNVFETSQLQALATLFLNLNDEGYIFGQFFHGLWVLPLGVLVYKSGFLPKIFGILFIAETFSVLLSTLIHFLSLNATLELNLLWIGVVAEITFTLWLLIRGINESKAKSGGYLDSAESA